MKTGVKIKKEDEDSYSGTDFESDWEAPEKDLSVKPKSFFYKFQFYSDIGKLEKLKDKILKIQENYQEIPEKMKNEYNQILDSGFPEWSRKEFEQFYKAFKENQIGDFENIADAVPTKT